MTADSFTQERSAWLQRVNATNTKVAIPGREKPVRFTARAKVVAYYISDHSSVRQDGCSWPSHGAIAKATGSSARAVQDAIDQLAAAGFLRVESQAGTRKPSRYFPSFT